MVFHRIDVTFFIIVIIKALLLPHFFSTAYIASFTYTSCRVYFVILTSIFEDSYLLRCIAYVCLFVLFTWLNKDMQVYPTRSLIPLH